MSVTIRKYRLYAVRRTYTIMRRASLTSLISMLPSCITNSSNSGCSNMQNTPQMAMHSAAS